MIKVLADTKKASYLTGFAQIFSKNPQALPTGVGFYETRQTDSSATDAKGLQPIKPSCSVHELQSQILFQRSGKASG